MHSHFLFTKVVQLDLRSSNFTVLNGFDMDFVCQFYHIFSRGFIPRTWNPVAITLAVASHNKRRLILTFTIAPGIIKRYELKQWVMIYPSRKKTLQLKSFRQYQDMTVVSPLSADSTYRSSFQLPGTYYLIFSVWLLSSLWERKYLLNTECNKEYWMLKGLCTRRQRSKIRKL